MDDGIRVIALMLLAWQAKAQEPVPVQLDRSPWHAYLETQGGPLPFALSFQRRGASGWGALVENGLERIEIPDVTWDGAHLLIDFPHYDSRIRADLDGSHLHGTWEKRRSAKETARLSFEA